MSIIKKILVLLVMVCFTAGALSYAQPKSLKKSVPSEIPANVKKGIEGLYSSHPAHRIRAIRQLGRLRAQAVSAVPYLIELLDDEEEIGPGILRLIMLDLSGIFGNTPRKEAILALAAIGSPAVELLIKALNDKNTNIRRGALEVLGRIKDSRAIEALIMTLRDEHMHWEVINILKKMGRPTVEPLIGALENKKSRIRKGAVDALGKIRDVKAVEPLIMSLKDKNPDVRWSVARALGQIRNRKAIEPLIYALLDENSSVQYHAALALEKITGKRFGENAVEWQEWWEKNKHRFKKAVR